jgi:hypothetical protein
MHTSGHRANAAFVEEGRSDGGAVHQVEIFHRKVRPTVLEELLQRGAPPLLRNLRERSGGEEECARRGGGQQALEVRSRSGFHDDFDGRQGEAAGSPPSPRADEQDNKKAKGDTPNSKLVIAAALKTKRLYSTVTSAANNFLVDIRSNDAWEWAQSEKQLHGLTTAQAAVAGVMDSFAMQFVSRDLQQLKRTMSSDVLQQHLSKFSLQLNPVLETLQKEASVLVRMQQARL